MNPGIAMLPSRTYYRNKIVSPLGYKIGGIFGKTKFPIFFVDSKGMESKIGNSYENKEEAIITKMATSTIKYEKFEPAVITPYTGQV